MGVRHKTAASRCSTRSRGYSELLGVRLSPPELFPDARMHEGKAGPMPSTSPLTDASSSTGHRDIHQLISECHVVLQSDPSCLHTLAVRGHACMKAKLWDQAVRDFSEILQRRPDDVHGRFSRGMALFKSGRVDDAHSDFSRVLELNPNHVMARYARAGCYNSEGAFNQAIQEYTLALQHDEKENAGGFRSDKRRAGMHESAEHLIRKTMGASARLRSVNQSEMISEASANVSVVESAVRQQQNPNVPVVSVRPRAESVPCKIPRKVVQVRVSLGDFAVAAPPQPTLRLPALQECLAQLEDSKSTSGSIQNQKLQIQAPRVAAVRAGPKTVRRVTVAL